MLLAAAAVAVLGFVAQRRGLPRHKGTQGPPSVYLTHNVSPVYLALLNYFYSLGHIRLVDT